jgi:F0F1-type ATP synthase assembly protein I
MAEEPEEEESTEAGFRRVQEELRAMELPEMPDDEVEARLEAIRDRPSGEIPDFEDSLTRLESRSAKARVVHNKAKNTEVGKADSNRKSSRGLGIGLAMAYTMLGLPLVGALLGFLLNRVFPGPWIMVGVVGGFCAGIGFALFLGNRERDSL